MNENIKAKFEETDSADFVNKLNEIIQSVPDFMPDYENIAKSRAPELLAIASKILTPSIVDLQNSQSEESTAPMTGIGKRMKVITLCGSTRFKEQFLEQQKRLTLEGIVVISVGLFGHSGDEEVWKPGTKEMLDKMHLQKIDMADEIFVINVGGYIGESTRREIAHAEQTGKPVRYLECI